MNYLPQRFILSNISRRRLGQLATVVSAFTIVRLVHHYSENFSVIFSSSSSVMAANNSTIRLGVVQLSFYQVVAGVVQNVLERLGHQVVIVEGSHTEIFPLLDRGDIDLLVAVWLPSGHQPLMEKYGSQAIELKPIYKNAGFFWGIPDYLPQNIQSIDDLTRPEVMEVINPVIQGIGEGAGITRLSQEVMNRYKLKAAGYKFRTGTEAEWVKAFEQGINDQNGVIIPLWQPQYLNQAYNIRRLEDPLTVFPPSDRCSLVITQNFRDRLSRETLNTLNRIFLGIEAVTAMDYWTNVENLSPQEAARRWMAENSAQVRLWMASSKTYK